MALLPPVLLIAACAAILVASASPPAHGTASKADELIANARAAISRGDGIDAEMKLREAIELGARPLDVNAYMGEAFLAQNQRSKARDWLAAGEFSQASALTGWRAKGLLERLDGNLAASGSAYDRALAIAPQDPELWVEIGRLRYAGGEHELAIDAAIHAVAIAPRNVRALEFRGQLVRDRYGLLAALPWFEKAIGYDPKDVSVLLEYAATLGEAGRAAECVTMTRRVLELSPHNARAYFLQAVIAARAGNYALARMLLTHTNGELDSQPAVMLLRGATELAVGNPEAAAEALEDLLRVRPDNMPARELLLRAILMGDQYRYAVLRFADEIAAGDATPYMYTLVARAWETIGDRRHAGELLDKAAMPQGPRLRILADHGRVSELLASGDLAEAGRAAEAMRNSEPGFYDAQSLAGDVLLMRGDGAAAQSRYEQASSIRLPASLFKRRLAAYALAGDRTGARRLTSAYLATNPASRPALSAAAELAADAGKVDEARRILTWLRDNGSSRDVELLSNLAFTEMRVGSMDAARQSAWKAYSLQRSSPIATQVLAMSYSGDIKSPTASALWEKARIIRGSTPSSSVVSLSNVR